MLPLLPRGAMLCDTVARRDAAAAAEYAAPYIVDYMERLSAAPRGAFDDGDAAPDAAAAMRCTCGVTQALPVDARCVYSRMLLMPMLLLMACRLIIRVALRAAAAARYYFSRRYVKILFSAPRYATLHDIAAILLHDAAEGYVAATHIDTPISLRRFVICRYVIDEATLRHTLVADIR